MSSIVFNVVIIYVHRLRSSIRGKCRLYGFVIARKHTRRLFFFVPDFCTPRCSKPHRFRTSHEVCIASVRGPRRRCVVRFKLDLDFIHVYTLRAREGLELHI